MCVVGIEKFEALDKTVQSEGLLLDHRLTADRQKAKKDAEKL